MVRHEIVVMNTIAICEYGVPNISAKYVMKCDGDTFVRVDTVLKKIKRNPHVHGMYMGKINLFHKPLHVSHFVLDNGL